MFESLTQAINKDFTFLTNTKSIHRETSKYDFKCFQMKKNNKIAEEEE